MNITLTILLLIFLPVAFAAAVYTLGKGKPKVRDSLAVLAAVIELGLALGGLIMFLRNGPAQTVIRLCGTDLTFRLDGFRAIYVLIAAFMWCMTLTFSPGYFAHYHNRRRYYLFNLLTLGATVGVFLSDDLYTTFIFFEIMSFASYPWVAHDESEGAMRAAQTYLAVAVLGGMVTLMGLFFLQHDAGTLSFEGLRAYAQENGPEKLYLPGILVFFGFAAKAGVFPLHIWLPKAHPVAPAPASALLSGILTKSGIFGILVVSCNLFCGDQTWGDLMLILGVITMVLGAVLALLSIDLKRTLACSSMSQIGFILIGVAMQCVLGEENGLAIRGTVLHMVNHSLLKLTLFMCAGTVYMNLHQLNLNDIRGYGRKKPLLMFCFLMGYLGIIGMPLFNGYISKSLLHESILEAVAEGGAAAAWYKASEILFLFSGGMTAAYMTKLFVCLFCEKNRDPKKQRMYDSRNAYLTGAGKFALLSSAIVLPALGLLPDLLMTGIGNLSAEFMHGGIMEHEVAYFSGENLKGAAISLAIGAVLYFGVRKLLMKDGQYVDRKPVWLDLENSVYRPLINGPLVCFGGLVGKLFDRVLDNPVVLKGIPTAVNTVTRGLDRVVENPGVTRYAAGGVTLLTRGADKMLDGSIVGLRRTIFHPESGKHSGLTGRQRTEVFFGRALNAVERIGRRLTGKKNKPFTDHVAWLAAIDEERPKASRYITRSLSFGLLMTGAALCVVLVWLLIR